MASITDSLRAPGTCLLLLLGVAEMLTVPDSTDDGLETAMPFVLSRFEYQQSICVVYCNLALCRPCEFFPDFSRNRNHS